VFLQHIDKVNKQIGCCHGPCTTEFKVFPHHFFFFCFSFFPRHFFFFFFRAIFFSFFPHLFLFFPTFFFFFSSSTIYNLAGTGVTVNACHPGVATSPLLQRYFRTLLFFSSFLLSILIISFSFPNIGLVWGCHQGLIHQQTQQLHQFFLPQVQQWKVSLENIS
jgi:preprotein translocase subunit SecY